MKDFAAKLMGLITRQKNPFELVPLDFVKTRKGILRELAYSRQSGNLIGIYSESLGKGMFLTVVEEIESTVREEFVIFGQYDMSGHILSRQKVSLSEIRMVCPFSKVYKTPTVMA